MYNANNETRYSMEPGAVIQVIVEIGRNARGHECGQWTRCLAHDRQWLAANLPCLSPKTPFFIYRRQSFAESWCINCRDIAADKKWAVQTG